MSDPILLEVKKVPSPHSTSPPR
jgi:hypothetical protein